MSARVHLIGATGRVGRRLARALSEGGTRIVPVVRDAGRWRALGLPGEVRVARLEDGRGLAAALADATCVISTAFAAHTEAVLAAAPPSCRLVLTGSARRYGNLRDATGQAALAAERLVLASGREAVMPHPTMIYGAADDGTVGRLAALIRRVPVLPLPGGGRALVQPIHYADMCACLMAAAARAWPGPAAFAVAGPTPLPYATLIGLVAAADGVRSPLLLPVPARLARLAGRWRPGIARMLEDRDADTACMRRELGIEPMPVASGLALMFDGRGA